MTKSTQDIVKLRAEIERCREEIDWLKEAQIPKDELKSRAEENCQALAEQFDAARHLGVLANPNAGFMEVQAMFRTTARVFVLGQLDVTSADSNDVGPMLAWAMGEALVQRMHAKIDRLDYRPGPPMAERPARLAELKMTMRTLEQQEEALICRGEETGVYIPRRADADPEVILAYDPNGKTTDPQMARTERTSAALHSEVLGDDVPTEASIPMSSTASVS